MRTVKAAVEWDKDRAYFFEGSEYARFDIPKDCASKAYPAKIAGNWSGLWKENIDAAINWGNGKLYFFKGPQYIRYDTSADRADDGYPGPIAANWEGIWDDGINAAVNWGNGKVYFFKGDEYIRYDTAADRADSGYPRKIAGNWPGLWKSDFDAAVNWGNGKVYFFKGSEYIRYDIAARRADPGYPTEIATNWRGLLKLRTRSRYSVDVEILPVGSKAAVTGYRPYKRERNNDWIGLYKDRFPANPNSQYVRWAWARDSPFLTDQSWNRRLRAAYIARDAVKDDWVYLARVAAGGDTFENHYMTVSVTNRDGFIEIDGHDTGAVGPEDWIGVYWLGQWWKHALKYPQLPRDPNSSYKTWQWVSKTPYKTDIKYAAKDWGVAYVFKDAHGCWKYGPWVVS